MARQLGSVRASSPRIPRLLRVSSEAQINFVASCTERKRATIPEELQLRSIPAGSPETRVKTWWSRLERHSQAPRYPASGLYGGEHWSLAQASIKALNRSTNRAFLWAASAGYGLVSAEAPLLPYSATFSGGVPDSVSCASDAGSRTTQIQTWWASLSTLQGPQADTPRSLRHLAETSPGSALLIVASPDYVRAMRPDLLAARDALLSPELLTVVSNRDLLGDNELAEHVIPVDQRSWTVLGGTMQGLNARVALELVQQEQDSPIIAPRLRERYESMVRDAEKPPKHNREKMNDDDVLVFLRSELSKNPRAGWTLLLRTLRGSGRACEQGRFRELHAQVREEVGTGKTLNLKLDEE